MSWQSYVDDHLVGSGNVTKAAIVGLDGNVWAQSPDFNVSAEEASALIAGFSKQEALQASGIFLSGEKFMFIKAEGGKEIIGKKGTSGMVAFKANTLVLISVHDENIVSGQCSMTTGKLADYLIENSM